jgi:beta-glucosidase
LAVQAIRSSAPTARVGIVLNLAPVDPASDSPDDRAAAEWSWQENAGWFLSPLLRAHYPPEVWNALGELAPVTEPNDLALISQPLDFLGVNFYFRQVVDAARRIVRPPDAEYTEMGWEVHAPSLRELLVRLQREYHAPPLYLVENGAAFKDEIDADGRVHDPRRLNYLREHITQARLAMEDGVDLRGYFVWSLMDNFEWAYGYSKRFGIVYVDYATQRRIPKDSAQWYTQVIAQNAIT